MTDVALETDDPVAALGARDIPTRAAAARDLSKVGTPEVIPRLVEMAWRDPSPAVRLGTAGAAADILSRYRLPPRAGELSEDDRRELLGLFRGIDPGVNPGLFNMLACLGLPEATQRIVVGLRDPRGGVRVGAGVGLMRLCTSQAALGDAALERAVVVLLRDHRLKPDALAEVARVCAAAGYRSALPALDNLDLPGVHGELVAESLEVLRGLDAPLAGIWVSDGRDFGEVNPEAPRPPALLVVGEAGVVLAEEGVDPVEVEDFPGEPWRRMHARRVGSHEPGPVLQALGRTFYAAGEADLVAGVDTLADPPAVPWGATEPAHPAAARIAELIDPLLPDTAVGLRARGLLLARAGRPDEALAALEAAVTRKKIPPDTWFFLGEARAAAGRADDARAAWEAAVKKSRRKRAWQVVRARERLAGEAG